MIRFKEKQKKQCVSFLLFFFEVVALDRLDYHASEKNLQEVMSAPNFKFVQGHPHLEQPRIPILPFYP